MYRLFISESAAEMSGMSSTWCKVNPVGALAAIGVLENIPACVCVLCAVSVYVVVRGYLSFMIQMYTTLYCNTAVHSFRVDMKHMFGCHHHCSMIG